MDIFDYILHVFSIWIFRLLTFWYVVLVKLDQLIHDQHKLFVEAKKAFKPVTLLARDLTLSNYMKH
jgi:hypothetical protein